MRALAVARRELASSLNSPVAYVAAVAYLLFSGTWLFFLNHFFAQNNASLRLYFNVLPIVFTLLLPVSHDAIMGRGEEIRHPRAALDAAVPGR